MTPEQEQKLNELYDFMQKLKSTTTIPLEVEEAFRLRLLGLASGLKNAPLSSITSPSGGSTADSQARTAIDSIITALENLGLISLN